jgi:hypothetical protein
MKTTFGEVKKKMEKPKKKLKPVFKSKCNPKSCAIVAFWVELTTLANPNPSPPLLFPSVIFAYFQVTGGLGFLFGITFPAFYSRFTSFFSGIASADVNNAMPIGCVVPLSHYISLLFYTLVPILLSLILLGLYLKFAKKDEASISLQNNLFEGFLVLSFLLLPNISIKIFSTFFCQDFDDGTR